MVFVLLDSFFFLGGYLVEWCFGNNHKCAEEGYSHRSEEG